MKWEVTIYPHRRKRLRWIPRRSKKVVIEAETASDAMEEIARSEEDWCVMRARKA